MIASGPRRSRHGSSGAAVEARPPRRASTRVRCRAGFTLVEFIIGIALVAMLAGVVVPNVLNRLAEAETARLASDVQAIGKAARMFRLHVRRWPGMMSHLMDRPDSLARDPFDGSFSSKYLEQWGGPYLEMSNHPHRDGNGEQMMRSSRGTLIRNRFTRVRWQGREFLQVHVDGVSLEDARAISHRVDGDTTVAVPSVQTESESAGRVRWLPPAGPNGAKGTLLYLVVRLDEE